MRMLSTKMQKLVSAKYSQKAPLAVERKGEFLIWLGIGLPLFLSSVPLMVRYPEKLPLIPVGIFVALGFLWQLIFYIGHRVTSFEKFKRMAEDEKKERLLYDSFWHGLIKSGVGLYTFLAMIWWLIELSLSDNLLAILVISLLFCAIFMVFCFTKREWLVVIAIDGLRKHKKVSNIIAVVIGMLAASQLLGGIARMARVIMGEAEAKAIMIPIALFILAILLLSIFLLTFLEVLITYAHYSQWQWQKRRVMLEGSIN
jgi:hypothetical protein